MADDNVYCEFRCGGCGTRRPGYYAGGSWHKPREWYERSDDDGPQVACSHACIDKIADRTGKTTSKVPL